MPCCAAFGCSTKKCDKTVVPPITLHRFPSDENERKKWILAVRRDKWKPSKRSFLCSKHFKQDEFDRSPFYTKLKTGALPSVFDAYPEHCQTKVNQERRPIKRHEPPQGNKRSPSKKRLKKMIEDSQSKLNELQTQLEAKSVELKQLNSSLDTTRKVLLSTSANLKEKVKTIKNLQRKTGRYKKKNCVLKSIISQLKEKSMLADEYSEMLSNMYKTSYFLYRRQLLKNVNPKLIQMYDRRLRSFAITLNFLSPKAYDFVRDQFDTSLPHRRTIGRWYSTVNVSAGFSAEVLEVLKEKAKQRPLTFALMFDGMAIRKRVDWDGSKFYGYVDFGCQSEDEEAPLAQEAIVFLLVGINSAWKVPIGFFFVNSITGEQLQNVTCLALEHLRSVGVTVTSITCDGASHNVTMLKKMGCSFTDPSNIKCKLNVEGSEVFALLDPCHLLKLVRNTLHDYSLLIDYSGREIKWQYFELLHQFQREEGLKLGNKLAKSHVSYENQKMKVKLAAQLFSDSVADAFQYCLSNNIKGFEGCEGTSCFVKVINKLFDLLNSRNLRTRGCKQALNPLNIEQVKCVFAETKEYLTGLKNKEGVSILTTKQKLGFLGFLLDMESTLAMYQTYVEGNEILKYFPTYKISQDQVERLFSYIRARGGRNNNPSCKEFTFSMRAILVHKQLHESSASSSNAIPLDKINILGLGSQPSCPINEINSTFSRNRMLDEDMSESGHQVSETEISDFFSKKFRVAVEDVAEYISIEDTNISNVTHDIVEYISGFVVKKLNFMVKCEACLEVILRNFVTSEKLAIKERGGLILPNVDVINICKICEKIFRCKKKRTYSRLGGFCDPEKRV